MSHDFKRSIGDLRDLVSASGEDYIEQARRRAPVSEDESEYRIRSLTAERNGAYEALDKANKECVDLFVSRNRWREKWIFTLAILQVVIAFDLVRWVIGKL